MASRVGIILAIVLACGLSWQWLHIKAQERRFDEVTAANAVLRRQAEELLHERRAAEQALKRREHDYENLTRKRADERAATARARRNPDFGAWADAALPDSAVGLLDEAGNDPFHADPAVKSAATDPGTAPE